jgi:hypothetical protein
MTAKLRTRIKVMEIIESATQSSVDGDPRQEDPHGSDTTSTSYARVLQPPHRTNKRSPAKNNSSGTSNPITSKAGQSSAATRNSTARTKIPAITLDSTMESMDFIKEYKATCNPNMVECRLVKNSKIIVKISNLEDYRSLLALATKSKLNHTVSKLKEEVPLKFVIRNLPNFVSPADFKDDFNEQGCTIIEVTQMKNKNKVLLPLVIVTLHNDELNQSILNLKYFLNMAVHVVPYEPMNKPLQCYNCQEFNHGASHCRRRLTCLHCAGEHSHKQCPTKCREETAPLVDVQTVMVHTPLFHHSAQNVHQTSSRGARASTLLDPKASHLASSGTPAK